METHMIYLLYIEKHIPVAKSNSFKGQNEQKSISYSGKQGKSWVLCSMEQPAYNLLLVQPCKLIVPLQAGRGLTIALPRTCSGPGVPSLCSGCDA